MLRPVNLESLFDILDNEKLLDEYRIFLNMDKQFERKEINDTKLLFDYLKPAVELSNFYVGFKIPQINKEFDLLRFTSDYILNIELKSKMISEEKIKRQLQKNLYYLKMFKNYSDVHLYTAVKEYENNFKIYELKDGALNEVTPGRMQRDLILTGREVDLSVICDPSNYLISPFNSTELFLEHKYFLTQNQQEIEKTFLNGGIGMYSLQGGAGTGKTLLAYDIAYEEMEKEKKVKIIHCANLNDGQEELNSNGWSISPIKSYKFIEFNNYDVVIFDEFQRASNVEEIITDFSKFKGKTLFCGDTNQWLGSWENKEKTFNKLKECNLLKKEFKVTQKIRTNKEVSTFIKQLFDNKKIDSKNVKKENIYIEYFGNETVARSFGTRLERGGWKVISLTTSLYNEEYIDQLEYSDLNSHKVIGQEFDRVAVFMGKNFYYDENGKLNSSEDSYYDSTKILFENITRTRKKLFIVIVNNREILRSCLEILNCSN